MGCGKLGTGVGGHGEEGMVVVMGRGGDDAYQQGEDGLGEADEASKECDSWRLSDLLGSRQGEIW